MYKWTLPLSLLPFLAGPAIAHQPRTQPDPSLAYVRAQTARFQDVNIALQEGYVPASGCEVAEMVGRPPSHGAMGVHYVRFDLLKPTAGPPARIDGVGTHTDFRTPAILLYEPQANGAPQLVGIENLVFASAWHAAGNKKPPKFRGREYNYMADDPETAVDEAHGFMPHYDLHVWLYRSNPRGMYEPFNPAVTCKYVPSPAPHH